MSETTATPEAAEEQSSSTELAEVPAVEVEEGAEIDDTEIEGGDDEETPVVQRARKEAAQYRTKLRAAEVERDEARALIDKAQRQIVDIYMNDTGGITSSAIWAAGYTPADLHDDDGQIDTTKLDAAIHAARQEFGLTSKKRIPAIRADGASSGRAQAKASWGDLINS